MADLCRGRPIFASGPVGMLKMICLRVEVLPLFGDGTSIAAEKVQKGCPQQGFGQTSVSCIASICKDPAATSAETPMGENLRR